MDETIGKEIISGGDLVPEYKKERSLRYSVIDGVGYSSMVGFGETFFIPLLVFLGASNMQVGIYSAIPQIGIALAQFLAIILVERLRVRKRIIVSGASSQVILLGAMAALLAAGVLQPWAFILLAVAYFSVNGAVIPSWNSLIGDLTSPETRGAYFGRRSAITQLVSFLALLAAGAILQVYTSAGNETLGFVMIIGAAMASRVGSVWALVKHFEVPYIKVQNADFSFLDFLKRSPKSNFGHFVYFVGLMSFAVYVSAPFFPVYMLKVLHFSYIEFTLAQGIFIATQFMAMRRWGPFADKYGNRVVLRITATLMPVVPICWLFSTNFYAILLFQCMSGLAWAGWTLATANFIFDAVTPPKRARCAAYLNFFNNMGIGVGSLVGAYLSVHLPSAIDTGVMNVQFLSNLNALFVISVMLRFAVVFLFLPTIREVREVSDGTPRDMFLMLTSVRPVFGAKFALFTGVDHKDKGGNSHK